MLQVHPLVDVTSSVDIQMFGVGGFWCKHEADFAPCRLGVQQQNVAPWAVDALAWKNGIHCSLHFVV